VKADASLYIQCHRAGLPGTEDPRIAKAVRAAEKDPALQGDLARQRAMDERNVAAVEQIALPQAFLVKLAAGPEKTSRSLSGKGALMQPIILAVCIGALTLLGWGGVTLWNRAHYFAGKDSCLRMVEMNDEMTGQEMEPKKATTGSLNDWFFDKYGFEDYYLPPGFENFHSVLARQFKQDYLPIAQVAIEEHNMVFYSFKAEDFGVSLPDDQWRVFTDGEWVAAIQKHDEECFMVAFKGTSGDMRKFLKSIKQ
jgi:hypothetical protein